MAAPDLLTTPAWRLLPANPEQPDLDDQPLLNDHDWLTPPPRRQSRMSQPPQEPSPPPPAKPVVKETVSRPEVVSRPPAPEPAMPPPPQRQPVPSPQRYPLVAPADTLELEMIEPQVPFVVKVGRRLFQAVMALLLVMMLLTVGLGLHRHFNTPPNADRHPGPLQPLPHGHPVWTLIPPPQSRPLYDEIVE